ncbi:MAG: hypothetical protein QXS42_03105 [Zestosphaera sp.]
MRSIGRLIIDLKQLHKRVFFYRVKVQDNIERLQSRLTQVDEPQIRNEILNNIRIYVNLCKTLLQIEAVLEVLIVKLESLGLLNISVRDISVVKEVLTRLRSQVSEIPDVSMVVDDLIDRSNDLLEFGINTPRESFTTPETDEVRKVLSEAEVIARERLKETAVLNRA